MIEYDFSGVDRAARQIYQKVAPDLKDINRRPDAGTYVQLNPTGFFLAARSCLVVKVEDLNSQNHLVLSVGDKELTARPGVRAH